MLKLPSGFRGIAPDLRGYGDTEDKLIDATRGAGDWVDDILALMDELKIDKAHVVGHSMGGTLVFNLVAAAPGRVLSGTVVNPGSPYGFGGSQRTRWQRPAMMTLQGQAVALSTLNSPS